MRLPYYFYGILTVFAFIIGFSLFNYLCKKFGILHPSFLNLSFVLGIPGILGARIAYILLFPEQFSSVYDYIAIHEGGLVFYGGFIASFIAFVIFLKYKKYNLWANLDLIVPSIALGHSIGRIGCLINHCCYGKKTDFIKIYKITNEHFYRHPTPLYESIVLFLVFVFVTKFIINKGKKYFFSANIALFYVFFYSIFRFFIEYIRDDDRGGFYTFYNLSPSQIISALLFISALIICFFKKKV